MKTSRNTPGQTTFSESKIASDIPPERASVKILSALLRMGISFGALGIVFYLFRSKIDQVGNILLTARWEFLIAAFAIYFSALAIMTYRLKIVMAVQRMAISLKKLFALGLVGLFFNNLLPSSIGGDAVKAYYAYRLTGKKLESFSAVLVDRVLGLFTLIGLALLAIVFFKGEMANPKIMEAVIVLALIAFFIFIFFASRRIAKRFGFLTYLVPSVKWRQKLIDLYHSIYDYKKYPKTVCSGLFLSVISQSCFIVVNFLMALSLNMSIPLWTFFVLIPIIASVSMAPSLNGLGVREGAYVYLFSKFSTSEQAFALSIFNYLVMISFSLVGGLVYLVRGWILKEAIVGKEKVEEV